VLGVRQSSVIVATLLGVLLLREPSGPGRVIGALLIVGGVVALRLWG
jgi:drug/metabolite transporter (DMT)-like permease